MLRTYGPAAAGGSPPGPGRCGGPGERPGKPGGMEPVRGDASSVGGLPEPDSAGFAARVASKMQP